MSILKDIRFIRIHITHASSTWRTRFFRAWKDVVDDYEDDGDSREGENGCQGNDDMHSNECPRRFLRIF